MQLGYDEYREEVTMTAKELYLYALDAATNVVNSVEPEDMELPTPDSEWDVHDLLQHIIYELAWTADIVEGKTIAEVGDKYEGALLNDDLTQTWKDYEAITRAAVEACDVDGLAHLSYADKSVAEYLVEAANDQLVHAWDLGKAVGTTVTFEEVAARQLYEEAAARQTELTESGLFAAPVETADDVTAQTKLLALLGRSEAWRS
jgi:uncharacterized protein (TIGR03086 family)